MTAEHIDHRIVVNQRTWEMLVSGYKKSLLVRPSFKFHRLDGLQILHPGYKSSEPNPKAYFYFTITLVERIPGSDGEFAFCNLHLQPLTEFLISFFFPPDQPMRSNDAPPIATEFRTDPLRT